MRTIAASGLDVYAHNVETVRPVEAACDGVSVAASVGNKLCGQHSDFATCPCSKLSTCQLPKVHYNMHSGLLTDDFFKTECNYTAILRATYGHAADMIQTAPMLVC